MIKRGVMFVSLIVFMLFTISFVFAATNTSTTDSVKVEKAYTCLQNKVKDKCSDLSTEEKIFSLLSISQCKNELIEDLDSEGCWPSSDCSIKTTSQAILALSKAGQDTKDSEAWLLSQTINPPDVKWYLEIIPKEEGSATCTVTYDLIDHLIKFDEDKKINVAAGSCLNLANNDYWLQVSSDCFGKEFTISCNKDFLTTLLYKKKIDSNSSTVYISEKVNSAVAEGKTIESIESRCFKKESSCDYEASLWATMVLDYKGIDVSPYLPYLITMADANDKYMPDSFLYLLTDSTDYQVNLISKQTSGYWDFSTNKFYDTSLAMLSFKDQGDKTDTKNWLLQTQTSEGCWPGIRDTAFILYSTWPKLTNLKEDCKTKDYFCMSSKNCKDISGNLLDYSCSGASVCCDKNIKKTCEDQVGIICSSSESCSGEDILASDLKSGESCCYNGDCTKVETEISNCAKSNGVCRSSSSCNVDETSSGDSCTSSGDICCLKKTTTSIFGYWWIWVLLILIILVIVGIIFKDKLRVFWFRIKSGKSSDSSPSSSGPGPKFFPPTGQLPQRIIPRRILPPSQSARRPIPRQNDEFSDILKKLKDIGK